MHRRLLDKVAFSAFFMLALTGFPSIADQDKSSQLVREQVALNSSEAQPAAPIQQAEPLQQMLVYHYCHQLQPKLIPCILYRNQGI